ncbi:hypothetical protein [Nisaea sediminum]|uniref:hypothetical protein n=1 Tax=Nisaea sediminum TaxID=2775867 RepID=UPI0018671DE5|nr:hypothetical protein [Nisaea sediminum]
MSGDRKEDFFVGYLKTPPRLAVFVAFASVLLIGLGIGGGLAMVAGQRDYTGGGFQGGYQEHLGVLETVPYPMLRLPPSEGYPEGRSILLIEPGKSGAQGRSKGLDGKAVDAGGVFVTRDGTRILQVGGAAKIRAAEDAGPLAGYTPGPDVPLGKVTLRGEIVDTKCYLGAMRPGEGKVHRACANLCLMGGIPPMLAVFYENAPATLFLLTDPDGKALDAAILDYVAPYVSVEGELFRRGDLLILRTSADRMEIL